MPKKASSGSKSSDSGADEADANVDKIRDILFGQHIRDYDNRFATLEKRLTDSIDKTSRDIEKRLERLDSLTRREFEKLGEQLKTERADRIAGDKNSATENKDLTSQVEGWFAEVEDQLSTEAGDIREALKEQGKELAAMMGKLEQQLQKEFARETRDLADNTVARHDLATLLAELAARINKDAKPNKS